MEKSLPGRKAQVGGWTKGVSLTASKSGGHGSSTSYSGSKRPGKTEPGTQKTGEFWPKGKSHYTQHHSG